jgi:N-[(2S)-2-amino-2-carboxyethyl]-L-glutamate dehydrogenase
MTRGEIRLLKGHEVQSLLAGRELEMIGVVQAAYEAHADGASSLPHSTFLHFPDEPRNRIIALPAYLGQDFQVAGVKWVASFPANHERGLARASAVVVLNSVETGQPEAILEGSLINAKRTAASAALAARHLHQGPPPATIGFVGCGLINREIARFLLAVFPETERFLVYDTDPQQAGQFADACRRLREGAEAVVAGDTEAVLRGATLVAMATTALEPYIADLSPCAPGSTILHISLRDITPQAILACDNIVDDVDHVLRAQTSLHLAEQLTNSRGFIRCTIADITAGKAPARPHPERVAVFSPFGLGVLDLAVSKLTLDLALAQSAGMVIADFLP